MIDPISAEVRPLRRISSTKDGYEKPEGPDSGLTVTTFDVPPTDVLSFVLNDVYDNIHEGHVHVGIEVVMASLLIRAAMNDHMVVGDLLAPGGGPRLASGHPPISQLVADAHVAAARPVLADHAQAAGIPYLVDPGTPLLQASVDPEDRWAKLPFAEAEAMAPEDVPLDQLIESVIEFELERGATVVIPPYFYASSPADPWFRLTVRSIQRTADHLQAAGIRLSLLPVLCAQLQSFSPLTAWNVGLDRFAAIALDTGSTSMAICLSPAGRGTDRYGKVMQLFQAACRMKEHGVSVLAWRQGIYGPGLVAAGLDGYECGLGTGEQTDIARRQFSRKPRKDGEHTSGSGAGIFIEPLGRSVPRRVGQLLLGNVTMRPKVMCDDESCCPSVAATLDNSRPHAVRTRARTLAELAAQPHRRWRLNHIARHASAAATLAAQANRVLAAEGVKERIKASNLEALAETVRHLAEEEPGSRIA